ncbi:MAG: hypothetical protein HC817_10640 [Saprospiraceae bacterium]|nr:hypothetical protein [Saprospiraceae bacterium]
MKKCITLILLYLSSWSFLNAQTLTSGDLMCVGFNADGNDDLSFVALAAIPANTTIYLRDDEWSGFCFQYR